MICWPGKILHSFYGCRYDTSIIEALKMVTKITLFGIPSFSTLLPCFQAIAVLKNDVWDFSPAYTNAWFFWCNHFSSYFSCFIPHFLLNSYHNIIGKHGVRLSITGFILNIHKFQQITHYISHIFSQIFQFTITEKWCSGVVMFQLPVWVTGWDSKYN